MTRTSDRRSNPGPRTTTEHARIPGLDPECRTRILRRPNFRSNGISFLRTAALPRLQSWAVSITNIGWRELLREGPPAFKNQSDRLFAESNGPCLSNTNKSAQGG